MLTVKNILVGTDFGDAADAALDYARSLSRTFGARLHVLHVVEPAFAGNFDLDGRITPLPELQFAMEDAERDQLEHLVSDDDRATLGATTVIRMHDTPAHAVIDYAANHDIDMIVVGTHGRHGLAHLVVGSVAEQIVRSAPCPVVTIRQSVASASPSGTTAAENAASRSRS